MQKPHAAARLFGEALAELDDARRAQGDRRAATDLPMASRPPRWRRCCRTKLAQPVLSKADWVQIGAVGRT